VASHDKLGLAQQLAAQLAGGVTNVVLLEGMLPAGLMRDDEEKREVRGKGGPCGRKGDFCCLP
jgi:hypothetical protein